MTVTTDAAQREAFDRDKVCYEQNCQQFRAMNQILWQVPLLAITITGGLWYAALSVAGAQDLKRPLFALSAIVDIALIFVILRVRYVMGAYLEKLKAFNPAACVEAPGTRWYNASLTVIRAFSTALALAAVGSIAGMFNFAWPRFWS
ncbi:MAG: hypothetical protein WA624_04135 [Methylocella sp.]